MNAVERLLNAELTSLMDRLAASVTEGFLLTAAAGRAGLRRRLDEAEARVAQARASVLEDYSRWQRALEDVENLCALAAWRSAAEDAPEEASSRAA